ncbi:MAG: hypothetical protein AAGB16_06315, partial [Pseudomonadota bacterium]
ETWLSDPLEALGAQKPLEAARLLVAVCRGSEFEVMARQQVLTRDVLRSRIETVLNGLLP